MQIEKLGRASQGVRLETVGQEPAHTDIFYNFRLQLLHIKPLLKQRQCQQCLTVAWPWKKELGHCLVVLFSDENSF